MPVSLIWLSRLAGIPYFSYHYVTVIRGPDAGPKRVYEEDES